jgi:hypothetical protein
MTTYEFLTWRQYYNEMPFGEKFEDYRAALSVKWLLAPHTKSEIPLTDFLLVPPEAVAVDPQDLVNKCQAFFGTMEAHNQEKV